VIGKCGIERFGFMRRIVNFMVHGFSLSSFDAGEAAAADGDTKYFVLGFGGIGWEGRRGSLWVNEFVSW
jgi:hypothetical protein